MAAEYEGKTLADIWAEEWEKAKDKMKRKIKAAKARWKDAALSPSAQSRYITNVIIAALEGRREARLKEVSPEDWAEAAVKGIDAKVLGDLEKRKWESRAAPYIQLVQWARNEFKKIAFPDGITAGTWWMQNVNKLLEAAAARPDKIPQIQEELRRRFEEAKRKFGTKAELTTADRLEMIRKLLARLGK